MSIDKSVSVNHTINIFTPQGFKTAVANIGIRDNTEDFVCIYTEKPCKVFGIFTKSLFAGPSIQICRENIQDAQAQALVVFSKNANVANGQAGLKDAQQIIEEVATQLNLSASQVLIASTGVIGRRYPMQKIMPFLKNVGELLQPADFQAAARGIMTTDTVPKISSTKTGAAALVGIAKGVGMIEPDMATLLTFFMTDADINTTDLQAIFKRVMDKTFNCLSIDSDTSTSDSAIIMANGLAGPVDLEAFEADLYEAACSLVKAVAIDGEGATKRITVTVDQARNEQQAKRIAKSIVNSPLVKTAVHGADPNWGRVAMAIGQCDEQTDISPEKTLIKFCGFEVYPKALSEQDLERLRKLLEETDISIEVSLACGSSQATVWGCDLSAEYVKINSEYAT